MIDDADVVGHYDKADLYSQILAGLGQEGLIQPTPQDLSAVDEFHIGGVEATRFVGEALAPPAAGQRARAAHRPHCAVGGRRVVARHAVEPNGAQQSQALRRLPHAAGDDGRCQLKNDDADAARAQQPLRGRHAAVTTVTHLGHHRAAAVPRCGTPRASFGRQADASATFPVMPEVRRKADRRVEAGTLGGP